MAGLACHYRRVPERSLDALIREGEDAYQLGDADRSARAFQRAAGLEKSGRVFEGLAKAQHLAFDYPAAMRSYERSYAAYRRAGDLLGAARAARTVGWFHGSLYGDWAVYSGWVGRARSLLEQAGEDLPEQGWNLLAQAQRGSDLAEQQRLYLEAINRARHWGDSDLECEALASLGIMLVFSGHTADGMAFLDEALATVCAGEVDDLSVVEGVFCGLFHTCEHTNDVPRAEQWLRAADDLVRRRRFAAVGGYCRAYYGGILTAAGRWPEAEAELTAALQVFSVDHVQIRGNVSCRLADLRLRQGRIEEAAQLLVGLEQHADAVRPLAALHLARGEAELAQDLLERALAATTAGNTLEGSLLALLVDAYLATGAVVEAGRTAERLSDLVSHEVGPYLTAVAALARGKVCRATGQGDARACLDEAATMFARAQRPVDVARVQLELANAVAATNPVVAIAQATAALASFERFQAVREADAAAALLRTLGVSSRPGPRGTAALTRRETEVLELLGHGLSNAEIGERLFISPKTVEHHVGRILAKLGVRRRAQAVAHAVHGPASLPGG